MNQLTLGLQGVTAHRTGADFSPALTLRTWRGAGKVLITAADTLKWIEGDWFNAGRPFADLKDDTFHSPEEEAVAISRLLPPEYYGRIRSGRSKKVYVRAYVCLRIPKSRRRAELTFEHHEEVARLTPEDQDKWLQAAVENEWAVADLRAAIGGRDSAEAPAAHGPVFVPRKVVTDTVRWFRHQFEADPVEQWTPERRAAVKREFAPLIEILNAL
jgi:hypothetical protein